MNAALATEGMTPSKQRLFPQPVQLYRKCDVKQVETGHRALSSSKQVPGYEPVSVTSRLEDVPKSIWPKFEICTLIQNVWRQATDRL